MNAKIVGTAGHSQATPLYLFNCAVSLTMMIGFKYIPASEPLTPLGMEVIGIFIGMLYGWLIVGDLFWPSVAGMVLLGLSDYTTVAKAFQSGFGNNTVLLLFFSLSLRISLLMQALPIILPFGFPDVNLLKANLICYHFCWPLLCLFWFLWFRLQLVV